MSDDLIDVAPAVESANTVSNETSEISKQNDAGDMRSLSVDRINEITQAAHKRGYEKALKSAENAQNSNQRYYSEADIENIVASKIGAHLEQHLQQQEMQNRASGIIDSFVSKVGNPENEKKYSDYKEVVSLVNFKKIPEIVEITSKLDNAADVIYEIAKNPHKLAQLTALSREHPQLAEREFLNISSSLHRNENASNMPRERAPINQLKNSPIGFVDGEVGSIEYFKNLYKV